MDNVGELSRRVSFPVYQDTRRNRIWRQLGGRKDDFFIYDRCGYLTYHIPFPRSLLNRRDFQTALWGTYFANPCNCDPSQSANPHSETGTSNTNHNNHHNHHHHQQQQQEQQQQHHHHQHDHHQQQQHQHHQQHHHQHQQQDDHHPRRRRRTPRDVTHGNNHNRHSHGGRQHSEITLHTNRMAEIFSNRISKCRYEHRLCHLLYSSGIRYRRRHDRFVNRLLQHQ